MAPPAQDSRSRILIADSQAVIRSGLRLALDEQPDMHVVAEACDAASALAALAMAQPDVAVVELDLPGARPLDLIRRLLEHPGLGLVLLSGSSDPKMLQAALAQGVKAALGKNAPTANLVDAIRAVREERSWIPAQVRAMLAPADPQGERWPDRWTHLTPRERSVAALVVQGLPYREVAARLAISDHTVKNHLRRIYEKLDINSRVELALHGASRGAD